MEFKYALESMCQRCSMHERCMGIGCHPKSTLESLIKEHDIVKKMYEDSHREYTKLLEKNEK